MYNVLNITTDKVWKRSSNLEIGWYLLMVPHIGLDITLSSALNNHALQHFSLIYSRLSRLKKKLHHTE